VITGYRYVRGFYQQTMQIEAPYSIVNNSSTYFYNFSCMFNFLLSLWHQITLIVVTLGQNKKRSYCKQIDQQRQWQGGETSHHNKHKCAEHAVRESRTTFRLKDILTLLYSVYDRHLIGGGILRPRRLCPPKGRGCNLEIFII